MPRKTLSTWHANYVFDRWFLLAVCPLASASFILVLHFLAPVSDLLRVQSPSCRWWFRHLSVVVQIPWDSEWIIMMSAIQMSVQHNHLDSRWSLHWIRDEVLSIDSNPDSNVSVWESWAQHSTQSVHCSSRLIEGEQLWLRRNVAGGAVVETRISGR